MKKKFYYAIIILITANANGQSWLLTGNAGTNPAIHFIGTTDARPLKFRVRNITAGYLDDYNTALGQNSFIITTTRFNTAIGNYALSSNAQGFNNSATGYLALAANNSGNYNSGFGSSALSANTTGSNNTATGANALKSNTSGNYNTASGHAALLNNITGDLNTAIGTWSMQTNTSGASNTAIGGFTLYSNISGNQNSAIGGSALFTNATGSYNTANGFQSMNANISGMYNAALGINSLYNNTTGHENTAIGGYALFSNITGSLNTAIGYASNVTSPAFINATAIGNQAFVDASNKVRIGSTSVMSIGGQVGWTIFSDGRFKQQIREDIPGIEFIKKLRPVSYVVDIASLDKFYTSGNPALAAEIEKINRQPWKQESIRNASAYRHSGFVAQEVEKAAKEIGYSFSGVDVPADPKGLYGIRYDEFVVPLVKAMQELLAKNEALEQRLQKLEAAVGSGSNVSGIGENNINRLSSASLRQNTPNPYSSATVIKYYIPADAGSATLVITGTNGQVLKTIPVSGKGDGQVTINADMLASGNYNYSLWVDGKLIESKKMMLQK